MTAPSAPSAPAAASAISTTVQPSPSATLTSIVLRQRRLSRMPVATRRKIAGHQHEIGGRKRHVGALRTHRDADRARLQRQRIVDAVADHHGPEAGTHFA